MLLLFCTSPNRQKPRIYAPAAMSFAVNFLQKQQKQREPAAHSLILSATQ